MTAKAIVHSSVRGLTEEEDHPHGSFSASNVKFVEGTLTKILEDYACELNTFFME